MFDAKTIRLAESLRPDLDFSVLGTEEFAILKIVENARGGGVVPIYDADIINGIASFSGVTKSKPLVSLKLNIPVTQTGSGTPSPTNIRDFVGVQGVNVSRTGKNLWNKTLIQGHVQIDNLKVGATYTATAQMINATQLTYCYLRKAVRGTTDYENIGYIIVDVTTNAITFTVENGYDYYVWCNASYTNVTDVQIELGDRATPYEPYTGNTYTISFGQTVYSAILDVLTGILSITHEIVDLGNLAYQYRDTYELFYSSVNTSVKLATPNCACSGYLFNPDAIGTSISSISRKINDKEITTFENENNQGRFVIKDTNYTDVASLKEAIAGIKLVYELAEPIEIQLTPTIINTLIGENVIFADVANVTECKFTRK